MCAYALIAPDGKIKISNSENVLSFLHGACDLVEVSAHSGARPEHAAWQGRIFSRSGTHPNYPDFKSSTGYGRADGLCGVNCRHTFGPFIEGGVPVWSEEKLKELDEPKYEYGGKQLTEYEASQVQRYNERQIRRWQREYAAMEAAGLDTSEAAAKLKHWQSVQADFVNKTGLVRQYEREQIAVAKIKKSSIIKSLDIEDFELLADIKGIPSETTNTIVSVIKEYEDAGEIFINDFFFGSLPKEKAGTPILQIEPIGNKILRLNVNVDFFDGRTVEEIDEILALTTKNLAATLREAVIHECGHAKLLKGLNLNEIKDLYAEIADAQITGVSEIAFSDGAEAIAEIEVLISRGADVPKEALEFYLKYVRRSST